MGSNACNNMPACTGHKKAWNLKFFPGNMGRAVRSWLVCATRSVIKMYRYNTTQYIIFRRHAIELLSKWMTYTWIVPILTPVLLWRVFGISHLLEGAKDRREGKLTKQRWYSWLYMNVHVWGILHSPESKKTLFPSINCCGYRLWRHNVLSILTIVKPSAGKTVALKLRHKVFKTLNWVKEVLSRSPDP